MNRTDKIILTYLPAHYIMETKNGKKVSNMKELIVKESIESLKNEGLKFSVDLLAEKLKISKKTIYKHFPNKELLAVAIYERYYDDLRCALNAVLNDKEVDEKVKIERLLLQFGGSVHMIREEVFNKFNLNAVIKEYAHKRHSEIWNAVSGHLKKYLPADELSAFKTIAEGSFTKLSGNTAVQPQMIAEMLGRIVC